jgi:hypothetical protein
MATIEKLLVKRPPDRTDVEAFGGQLRVEVEVGDRRPDGV